MKKLLNYFFQGLLFTLPVVATGYIIYTSFVFIDGLLPFDIPGIGLFVILASITFFGYLSKFFIANPIVMYFNSLVEKTPLVKLIYSSIKDLMSAFVGKKKRFNQPVLVQINKDSGLQKLGFVTQEDLSYMGLKDKVAVYLPHSYNFSGNLFIVPKENITPINISGTELMKFIVSGGVTEI